MRSTIVTVVVARTPATAEYMAQYELLDVHDETGAPAYDPEPPHGISDAEWAREYISNVGLLFALFGDYRLPVELRDAKKFLVRGRMVVSQSGNPFDGYDLDSEFEWIETRALPGEVREGRYKHLSSWEEDEPIDEAGWLVWARDEFRSALSRLGWRRSRRAV